MSELLLTPRNPAELVGDALQAFVDHPSLQEIAEHFGFTHDDDTDHLEALHGFAQQNWDFRAGRQRSETDWPVFEPSTSALVVELIHALPLMQAEAATQSHYNVGAAFGCGGSAAYNRVARLLEQYHSGVTFDCLVLLGSERMVSDGERQELGYPPTVTTEFELMNAAFESKCATENMHTTLLNDISSRAGRTNGWRIREYDLNGIPVFSLSSDYRMPPRGPMKTRADTRDTLAFLRAVAGDELQEGASILGVTGGPSIIYQHFLALEELTIPTGTRVEMIGYNEPHSAAYLLQEVVKAGLDHALSARIALAA